MVKKSVIFLKSVIKNERKETNIALRLYITTYHALLLSLYIRKKIYMDSKMFSNNFELTLDKTVI